MTSVTRLIVTSLPPASHEPSYSSCLSSLFTTPLDVGGKGPRRAFRLLSLRLQCRHATARDFPRNSLNKTRPRRPPNSPSHLPTSRHLFSPAPSSTPPTLVHPRSSPYQIAFRAVHLPCSRSAAVFHGTPSTVSSKLPHYPLAARQDSSQDVLQPVHHPRLHGRPGGSLARPEQYVLLLLTRSLVTC